MEKTPLADIYLRLDNPDCDRVQQFVESRKMENVAYKFIDADPRWAEELAKEGGGMMDTPALRRGNRWMRDPDQIIAELDKLSTEQPAATCPSCGQAPKPT